MAKQLLSQQTEAFINELHDLDGDPEASHCFMHPVIILNGEQIPRCRWYEGFMGQYGDFVDDMIIFIRELVVDESKETVSVRIEISGESDDQEDGFEIIEHNMYKWRNGQIAEIWTLKDHSDLERYKAAQKAKA